MNASSLPELAISTGNPYPFGATMEANGVNFAVYIKDALEVTLCFFETYTDNQPTQQFVLDPVKNRTGEVWHIYVANLPAFTIYAYRVKHKEIAEELLLLDPYAKAIASSPTWNDNQAPTYRPFGKVIPPSTFDWQEDRFPNLATKDLIIYEMHIRGFTKDASSQVQYPGTYLGVIEKIPYLKELGINAVEIMPIHEFNEQEAIQINPKTKQKLCNYFGYSTVNFFSPMNRYASQSADDQAINEFKMMVRELHKNGIEVILDVVYNHTFEGNHLGPALSFKGFDPHAYYMIDAQGNYLNFSGCGNTLNTNQPVTREMIIDSLRYWVVEMHVDGFRFDLASILTRAENGSPLSAASVVEAISQDPLLANRKLIAEAWDAGGLYQVGGFYPGTRWSEWNGYYRDVIRRFIKGTSGYKKEFATVVCGSQNLYGWRNSPICSVNFITAHDGFSLADLVSYNSKHNEENGEDNRDGFDHNDSWNCGLEGHSSNKKIVYLRERQIRNFQLALMVSQGIPMILMGDEYAHTRHGNNNTWCQDNELNWFLWNRLEVRPGFHRFFRSLLEFRKNHPLLTKETFLQEADITWHGYLPMQPDWDKDNGFVAFTLQNEEHESELYIAFNASHLSHTIVLPPPPANKQWHWIVNTHNTPPDDFFDAEHRFMLMGLHFHISSYSAIMLQALSTT